MKKYGAGTDRRDRKKERKKEHIWKYTAAICTVALLSTAAGCGKKIEEPKVTPTPAATATPVLVTSTPVPTPTQAVKMIGIKTKDAKMVYLTNGTKAELRGIYLKGTEEEEWGRNLVPAESSVKAGEQVRMYYIPLSAEEEGSYDLKIVTEEGSIYELLGISMEDMERASLKLDEEKDLLSLRYMSLRQKKEVITSGSDSADSQDEDWEEDYEEEEEEEEDSSYWEPEENTGNDQGDDGGNGTGDGTDDQDDSTGGDGEDSQNDGSDDGGTDGQEDGSIGDDGQSGNDGNEEGGNGDDSDDGAEDGSGDIIWDENGNWIEG